MRRDGDALLALASASREELTLCAPFIKAPVIATVLAQVRAEVTVRVVTRWRPEEVAAGVSDLEVFELVTARPGARLELFDQLHAKLYVADQTVLTGSANLTATALGWSETPNLEILAASSLQEPSVVACLEALRSARLADAAERDRVRIAADRLTTVTLPDAAPEIAESLGVWLPRLGAPARLYEAYMPGGRDRLIANTLEAADADLRALALPPNLSLPDFNRAVAQAFTSMAAIAALLHQAGDRDLTDDEAIRLIASLPRGSEDMPPEAQWRTVRDWMTHFLGDLFEVAPQTFITRRRPGASL